MTRMRAPTSRCRASTSRRPRTGRAGCSNGGSGASSGNTTDRSRSCSRSASGWMRRRERSKAGEGIGSSVGSGSGRENLRAARLEPIVARRPGGDNADPDVLASDESAAPPRGVRPMLVQEESLSPQTPCESGWMGIVKRFPVLSGNWARALLAPALVFIATSVDRSYQTDFWHHLARGRAIAETGTLVNEDLFTYTVAHQPFQDTN